MNEFGEIELERGIDLHRFDSSFRWEFMMFPIRPKLYGTWVSRNAGISPAVPESSDEVRWTGI